MSNDAKWTDWWSFDHGPGGGAALESSRSAWVQLGSCVVGLSVLAAVLPGPRAIVGLLIGEPVSTINGSLAGSTAQPAILAAAGLLVWGLLIWSGAVCAAAAAGRLPGVPGSIGRALLGRIAPAAAGRLIATAIGVSLLAGTSACAASAEAGVGSEMQTTSPSTEPSRPLSLNAPSTSALSGAALTTSAASVATGDGSEVMDPASSAGSAIASTGQVQSSPPGTAPDPASPSSDGVIASLVIDWPVAAAPAAPNPGSTASTALATNPAGTAPSTTIPTAAGPTAPGAAPPSAAAASPAPPGSGPITTEPAAPNPAASEPQLTPSANQSAVTVRAGDSLWSIATQYLQASSGAGDSVSDAQVDSAWRAWYVANSKVIGIDPDLIRPGQLLLPPPPR